MTSAANAKKPKKKATKAADEPAKAKAKPLRRSVAPAAKRASAPPESEPEAAETAESEGAESTAEAKPARIGGRGTLLIVESPAKAKTIQKYLGRGYVVIASKGHVKDLPKRGGVDVEQRLQGDLRGHPREGQVRGAADDPRRGAPRRSRDAGHRPRPRGRGDRLAPAGRDQGVRPEVEIRRVLFNEITKKGVNEGIDSPRDLDPYLYEAQRTRRVLDRIGGYPLSNLLWRKLAFGLSAGRVQTPALRIIVDRQHEIDSFIPRPYWLLEAQLGGKKPPPFIALLDSVGGEKLEKVSSRPAATSELDAKRFEQDLNAAAYRVSKVIKRERKARAPAPYTTSQAAAGREQPPGHEPQARDARGAGAVRRRRARQGREGETSV